MAKNKKKLSYEEQLEMILRNNLKSITGLISGSLKCEQFLTEGNIHSLHEALEIMKDLIFDMGYQEEKKVIVGNTLGEDGEANGNR